jgi:hypothetical protein
MIFLLLILAALLWVAVFIFWSMSSESELLFNKVLGWILGAEAIGVAMGFFILFALGSPEGLRLLLGSLAFGTILILGSLVCLGIEAVVSRR